MTESNPQPKPNPNEPEIPNFRFGGEIDIEEGGFIFRPIEGFELEIDRTVYMYSEDGNIETSLVGGELKEGTSISELNDLLASEFMESFDEFRVEDAGTDRIQEITGFLNDLHFKNAEEEGQGFALTGVGWLWLRGRQPATRSPGWTAMRMPEPRRMVEC